MNSINIFTRIGKKDILFVWFSVYIKRVKVRFNSKITVKPQDWDEKINSVRKSDPFYRDKNLVITQKLSRINDVFVKFRLTGQQLTPEILKAEVNKKDVDADFIDFLMTEMGKRRGIVTEATHAAHLSLLNKLREFQPKILFSDINEDFLRDFQKYMKIRLANSQNTIQKTMVNLKVYVLIAIRKKIITENPFVQVKFRRTKVDKVALSRDEVSQLFDYYRKEWFDPNLSTVLRMFLFSCFTGLRLSDVKRVESSHIYNGILVINPHKLKNVNAQIVKIPLSEKAFSVLKDKPSGSGPIFEAFSDQTTNKYLKKVADLVGITKKITFHSARHTFATLYLEANRGDVATLQQLMGHSNIEQTMEYVHITEETKREGIEKLDRLF